MKKFASESSCQPEKLKIRQGFTLIELLVVIGIIGILAAGILAAIDPLEQLKKGRDTNKRSICVEIFNALTRYYAINGQFPWGAGSQPEIKLADAEGSIITPLITTGELKPEFMRGLPAGVADQITICQPNPGGPVYICFDPESKSISADPSTIYVNKCGDTGAPCNPPSPSATCYWCSR